MDLVLTFQSDGIHPAQNVNGVVLLNVDQAEVVDHGGHVGERGVTVSGNLIDFTSVDGLSFAVETTKQVNLSVHVTRLAVAPGRSHGRQGDPGAFHSVKLGRCVEVIGFFATLLDVPTENVDTVVDPDRLGGDPLLLVSTEELPGALGDVERPHLRIAVAADEVQVEAYHNANAERKKNNIVSLFAAGLDSWTLPSGRLLF